MTNSNKLWKRTFPKIHEDNNNRWCHHTYLQTTVNWILNEVAWDGNICPCMLGLRWQINSYYLSSNNDELFWIFFALTGSCRYQAMSLPSDYKHAMNFFIEVLKSFSLFYNLLEQTSLHIYRILLPFSWSTTHCSLGHH